MKTIFLHSIPVTLDRRRIKNINLYVRPPRGEVLVTAPLRVSEAQIMKFLYEKEEWIIAHQRKIAERAGERGENDLRAMEDRRVTKQQADALREMVGRYAGKWEPVMGVHCAHWTLRDMKSRWGSCSVQKRTIRINLQLAKKPEECVEYVVVHELTHLLEASHNERFHAYMKQFLPDYKERKKLLEQSGFF